MKFKVALIISSSIVGLLLLTFGLGLFNLEYMKFFNPRKENIRREVFENTQSYNHGKAQELAKYFEEYQKVEDSNDKDAIDALIKLKFAEFDERKINALSLRNFLIQRRGY